MLVCSPEIIDTIHLAAILKIIFLLLIYEHLFITIDHHTNHPTPHKHHQRIQQNWIGSRIELLALLNPFSNVEIIVGMIDSSSKVFVSRWYQ